MFIVKVVNNEDKKSYQKETEGIYTNERQSSDRNHDDSSMKRIPNPGMPFVFNSQPNGDVQKEGVYT